MGENVRDDLRWEELKPDAVDGEPGPESPPEFRKAALTEKPQTSYYSTDTDPVFCFKALSL